MMPILNPKNGERAWLAYFVAVMFLGWWPWNAWLIIIGAACCWILSRPKGFKIDSEWSQRARL